MALLPGKELRDMDNRSVRSASAISRSLLQNSRAPSNSSEKRFSSANTHDERGSTLALIKERTASRDVNSWSVSATPIYHLNMHEDYTIAYPLSRKSLPNINTHTKSTYEDLHYHYQLSLTLERETFPIYIVIPRTNDTGSIVKHTEYMVELIDCRKICTVMRRFRDFIELDAALHASLEDQPEVLKLFPEFPQKKVLGKMNPAFVERRRHDLESYLRNLLSMKIIVAGNILWKFLEADGLTVLNAQFLSRSSDANVKKHLKLYLKYAKDKACRARISHPALIESFLRVSQSDMESQELLCRIFLQLLKNSDLHEIFMEHAVLLRMMEVIREASSADGYESIEAAARTFCLEFVRLHPNCFSYFCHSEKGIPMLLWFLKKDGRSQLHDFVALMLWHSLDLVDVQECLCDPNGLGMALLDALLTSYSQTTRFLFGLILVFLLKCVKDPADKMKHLTKELLYSLSDELEAFKIDADAFLINVVFSEIGIARIKSFLSINTSDTFEVSHYVLWSSCQILKVAIRCCCFEFAEKYRLLQQDEALSNSPTFSQSITLKSEYSNATLNFKEVRNGSPLQEDPFTPKDDTTREAPFAADYTKYMTTFNRTILQIVNACNNQNFSVCVLPFSSSSSEAERTHAAFILLWLSISNKRQLIGEAASSNEKDASNVSLYGQRQFLGKHKRTAMNFNNSLDQEVASFISDKDSILSLLNGSHYGAVNRISIPHAIKCLFQITLESMQQHLDILKILLEYTSKEIGVLRGIVGDVDTKVQKQCDQIHKLHLECEEFAVLKKITKFFAEADNQETSVEALRNQAVATIRTFRELLSEVDATRSNMLDEVIASEKKLGLIADEEALISEELASLLEQEQTLRDLRREADGKFKEIMALKQFVKQLKENLKRSKQKAARMRAKWMEMEQRIAGVPQVRLQLQEKSNAAQVEVKRLQEEYRSVELCLMESESKLQKRKHEVGKYEQLHAIIQGLHTELMNWITTYKPSTAASVNDGLLDESTSNGTGRISVAAAQAFFAADVSLYKHCVNAFCQTIVRIEEAISTILNSLPSELVGDADHQLLYKFSNNPSELALQLKAFLESTAERLLLKQGDNFELESLEKTVENWLDKKQRAGSLLEKASGELEVLSNKLVTHTDTATFVKHSEMLLGRVRESDTEVEKLSNDAAEAGSRYREYGLNLEQQKIEILEKEEQLPYKKMSLSRSIDNSKEFRHSLQTTIYSMESNLRFSLAVLESLSCEQFKLNDACTLLQQQLNIEHVTKENLRDEVTNLNRILIKVEAQLLNTSTAGTTEM